MTRTTEERPHRLDRQVVIHAAPEVVFGYLTDTDRWAAWWGAGSSIDARPGGAVTIRYPGGVEASGEVVAIDAPTMMAFTYGYVSGTPIAVGASLVTIRLEAEGLATRLTLTHAFDASSVRDEHVQGWRYQLSIFGNLVADAVHAEAGECVDAWFAAWSDPDAAVRETTLQRIAAPQVGFRDRYSLVDGLPDLLPHLAAVHRFMPGMVLRREGDVRHCQGVVLADWVARGTDGRERGRGTNVFTFDPRGRIVSVVGFWAPPAGVRS